MFKMKKTLFIKNAAILTASSLILRFAGIVFKVWLASAIGAEGIGLYQLVFSVYVLASTFATSGICTAVTRLVADELAIGSRQGTLKILRRGIFITLCFAAMTIAALLLFGDFIAVTLLGDTRAAPSIKILSLSLPFMGISSCLRGYFIARRKTGPCASSQIFEQAIRILVVLLGVKYFAHMGLTAACTAVLLGDTVAEALSCLFLYLRFLHDRSQLDSLSGRTSPPFSTLGSILRISTPITAGKYLNSLLRTGENLMVPRLLSLHAGARTNALSLFGMIKGMALPVLFFPSTLLGALSTLLIPEISEARSLRRHGVVRGLIEEIIRLTALISFIFAAVFLVCGYRIGNLLYKSADVGFLLTALSPIVPLMYLDSVCDGILKGLDQQLFTFRTAIVDSLLRIGMIVFMLPRWGIWGFITVMYISNLLTCLLNVRRLLKCSNAHIPLCRNFIIPLLASLTIVLLADCFLSALTHLPNLVYIILICIISLTAYTTVLFVTKAVDRDLLLTFKK